MNSTAQKKKIEEIKKDLFSGDDGKVLKAVKACQEEGNAALVEPLLTVFATTSNLIIKQEVGEMLNELKVSNVDEAFRNALKNPEFISSRKEILSFIWGSGIQPVEDVVLLTEIAIEGSFEEALECHTIIESIEDGVAEADLLEAASIARTFISSYPESDKKHLIADILVAIEGRQELEDEL